MNRIRREVISDTLRKVCINQTEFAKRLGLSEKHVSEIPPKNMLKKYGYLTPQRISILCDVSYRCCYHQSRTVGMEIVQANDK